MRSAVLTAVAMSLGAAACARRAPTTLLPGRTITTDSARLTVPGGQIWYRAVGGGSGVPLILVHGGPGTPSVYLKSLEALRDERIVVRYDQLGAGKSQVATDASLFNIAHFVNELELLRRHLGVERANLYGHSWGATLAVEYYRAHPEHVASLILSSPALDAQAFYAHMRKLFAEFPDSARRAVELHDAGSAYDTAAYRSAMMQFNMRHGTRRPVRADMDTLAKTMNPVISEYMNGTSVYRPNGTISSYNAIPFLKSIRVPVLFVVGEYDFVGPGLVRQHASLTPGARFVVIPDAGHMTSWDNAAANTGAVRSFLREVDAHRRN